MKKLPKILKQKRGNGVYATVRATIAGKQKSFYLGRYGSPEAERKYRKFCASLMTDELLTTPEPAMSIAFLYHKFLNTIEGKNDSESTGLRRAIKYAVECFGDSLILDDFADDTRTIRILTEFQQYLLSIANDERVEPTGEVYGDQSPKAGQPRYRKTKKPWTYTGINRMVKKWISVLRWGCRQGILPFAIFRVLDALKPLNARSGLPRSPEVQPAADDALKAVLPYMTPTIREMVQIQRGTGMRAKEVCDLLVGDIDKTGDCWFVRTDKHKTAAHLRYRYFAFSAEETALLRQRCAGKKDTDHVFSQRENFAEFWAQQRAQRKTHVQPVQQQRGEERQNKRLQRYHDFFSERSYAQSIRTACRRARKAGVDVADINPKSIRHAAYTEYSDKYGVELASKNAGHTSPRMADVYDHSLRYAAQKLASERGLFGSDLTKDQKEG